MKQANRAAYDELPADWAPALVGVDPGLGSALAGAWGELVRSPDSAARRAESIFPELCEHGGLAPWLALVIAVSGRVNALSMFRGLDPLIDFFDQHRERLRAPESVMRQIDACYFAALVFRCPEHPRIAYWADACLEAFESVGDPYARLCAGNYLLLHRIWRGDLLGADALRRQMVALREQTDDARALLLCHSISAMSLRLFLDYEGCRQELERARALAEETGIRFWDSHLYMQGALLGLSRENLLEAGTWLDRMEVAALPEHALDRSGYCYVRAWHFMLQGDITLAVTYAEEAVRRANESGALVPLVITRMGLAQLFLDRRQVGRALYQIRRARQVAKSTRADPHIRFARGLATAHVCFRLELRQRGLAALRQALAIGREQRYVNFPWWQASVMSTLCARALEAGIEPEYVRWVISKRHLRPPPDFDALEDWTWPIRVELLGAPHIVVDGGDIELGAKARELVLALASRGDAGGWVERAYLVDRLWPDSDGDRAQRSLDTSIHRLRKALASESVIRTRPGAVLLDPGLCYVDYWHLLRVLKRGDATRDTIERLVDGATRLISVEAQTHPLGDVVALCRRIARRVLEKIDREWRGRSEAGPWLEALVEAVPEYEYAWQALIRFYLAQQTPSAAVDAWHRCSHALETVAGCEPAPATYALVVRWINRRHAV